MPDVVDSRSAIFDAALDAIITVNHEGRILEFSAAGEQLFGVTRGDACGRLLVETIIPERFREPHRQGMRRYLETGETAVLGRRVESRRCARTAASFRSSLPSRGCRTSSRRSSQDSSAI